MREKYIPYNGDEREVNELKKIDGLGIASIVCTVASVALSVATGIVSNKTQKAEIAKQVSEALKSTSEK